MSMTVNCPTCGAKCQIEGNCTKYLNPDALESVSEGVLSNGEALLTAVLIEKQQEIARLNDALHEIREVYAGMEGVKLKTTQELYLFHTIQQIYRIALEASKIPDTSE